MSDQEENTAHRVKMLRAGCVVHFPFHIDTCEYCEKAKPREVKVTDASITFKEGAD